MTAAVLPPINDEAPPDVEARRGPLVVPAPLAYAQVLGIPARPPLRAPKWLRTPTPEAVMEFFRVNNGTGEYPNGSNINFITDWWGLHDAWCAMTCAMAMMVAGFTLDDDTLSLPGWDMTTTKGWARVSVMAKAFYDAGFWSDTPTYGSFGVVVYPTSGDWLDWNGWPGDHICAVDMVVDAGDRPIPWAEDHTPSDPGAVASVASWDGNIGNSLNYNRRSIGLFHGFCRSPYPAGPPVDRHAADRRRALAVISEP